MADVFPRSEMLISILAFLYDFYGTNISHDILNIMLLDTIIMVDTINIFSFNARGLGNKIKRNAIFEWLHSKRGIFFIQESHSSPESEIVWQEQWDGKIFFSNGELNSYGAVVLIAPDTYIRQGQKVFWSSSASTKPHQ